VIRASHAHPPALVIAEALDLGHAPEVANESFPARFAHETPCAASFFERPSIFVIRKAYSRYLSRSAFPCASRSRRR
jgi:hypothetical protein